MTNEEQLAELARSALAEGTESAALSRVRDGAARMGSAALWQWTGLLNRALDRHEQALEAFSEAARLAPDNALIAQGRAHTAMEAGVPAVALYEAALRLAPTSGPVLIGLAAARNAEGDADGAESQLRQVLDRAPLWLNGHVQLAQMIATHGRPDEATASLERAIARMPAQTPLWETLLNVELSRGAYARLKPLVERARAAGARSDEFAIYDAIHEAEFDDRERPPALFDQAPTALDGVLTSWRVRHLLRIGRADQAIPLLDQGLQGAHSAELWAYAATAWRLTDDPRSAWLEGDPAFVQIIDLADQLGDLSSIVERLRALHQARGEYLDQSVRGGTQTDGPLFCRIEPEVRRLRAAVTGAVEAYRDRLPPIDPGHPLLRHRRDALVRYAGSWSVRLRSGGRHSNHVHPLGWISSALYLALPDRTEGERPDAGWLTLGEPDDKLALDVAPWRTIEPTTARLVLFPSWMWHGTVPFESGERLTVAFDVAPPR